MTKFWKLYKPQSKNKIYRHLSSKKLLKFDGKTPEREDIENIHFDATVKIALLIANSKYD